MANKRIYYPCEQFAIKADGAANYVVAHGVQDVSMTTNFNLEQIFELGQSQIYQNLEDVPDIEIQASKVLDGYPLLTHLMTAGTTAGPSLLNRSTSKCLIALGIFSDTADSASGHPLSEVECSGVFWGSTSFSFPVQGNGTESITAQCNDKVWANDSKVLQTSGLWTGATSLTYDGQFSSNNDTPLATAGVHRRQNLIFAYNAASSLDANGMVADPDATILPPDIFGISSSGTNEYSVADGYGAHIQDINISCQMNREPLYEQGSRAPYTRSLTLPVEVTCEVTVISSSGDMISATTKGIRTASDSNCAVNGNLIDRTIRIATCEGTRIYLGTKNKLSAPAWSGGGSDGRQCDSNLFIRRV